MESGCVHHCRNNLSRCKEGIIMICTSAQCARSAHEEMSCIRGGFTGTRRLWNGATVRCTHSGDVSKTEVSPLVTIHQTPVHPTLEVVLVQMPAWRRVVCVLLQTVKVSSHVVCTFSEVIEREGSPVLHGTAQYQTRRLRQRVVYRRGGLEAR